MEREIVELRKQVARQASPTTATAPAQSIYQPPRSAYSQLQSSPISQWGGSQEAVAGLLDLKSGYDSSSGYLRNFAKQSEPAKRIEDVAVSQDQVDEVFHLYVLAIFPLRLNELTTLNTVGFLHSIIHFFLSLIPKNHPILSFQNPLFFSGRF